MVNSVLVVEQGDAQVIIKYVCRRGERDVVYRIPSRYTSWTYYDSTHARCMGGASSENVLIDLGLEVGKSTSSLPCLKDWKFTVAKVGNAIQVSTLAYSNQVCSDPNFFKSKYARAQEQEINDNAHAAIFASLPPTPEVPNAVCEQEGKKDKAMPTKVPLTFVNFIPNKQWEQKDSLLAYAAFSSRRQKFIFIAVPKIGMSMRYSTKYMFTYCGVSCEDFTSLKLPLGDKVTSEWKFLEGQVFKVVNEFPDMVNSDYICVTRLSWRDWAAAIELPRLS